MKRFLAFFLILVFVVSCDEGEDPLPVTHSDPDQQQNDDDPDPNDGNSNSDDDDSNDGNSNDDDPDIIDGVIIIDKDKSILISTENDIQGGIYIIDFLDTPPEIEVNDIIVSDIDEGFLRRVNSVVTTGTKVTMETSQATLDDIFDDASIQLETDISNSSGRMANKDKVKINYIKEGVRLEEAGLSYDFSNTVLYSGGGADVRIKQGKASFNPKFTFNVDYTTLRGLEFFEFKTDDTKLLIDGTLDIKVDGILQLRDYSVKLLDYDKFFYRQIGTIPVVLVMNTQLVAELNSEVGGQVNLSSGWYSNFNLNTGVGYQSNTWTPYFQLVPDLGFNNFEISAVAGLQMALNIVPKSTFKLYGVIGPYIEPKLTSKLNKSVWLDGLSWKADLTAGIELTKGVDISIFGTTIEDFSTTDNFEKTIWSAPTNLILLSEDRSEGFFNEVLEDSIKVKVTDLYDNPLPLATVTFEILAGNGEAGEKNVRTGLDGVAGTTWKLADAVNNRMRVSLKHTDGTNTFAEIYVRGKDYQNLNYYGNLNFGNVILGTDKSVELTIENPNPKEIKVTSIELPDELSSNWDSGTIGPNSSQIIEITFEPTEAGEFSDQIVIKNDLNPEGDKLSVKANSVSDSILGCHTFYTSTDRKSCFDGTGAYTLDFYLGENGLVALQDFFNGDCGPGSNIGPMTDDGPKYEFNGSYTLDDEGNLQVETEYETYPDVEDRGYVLTAQYSFKLDFEDDEFRHYGSSTITRFQKTNGETCEDGGPASIVVR